MLKNIIFKNSSESNFKFTETINSPIGSLNKLISDKNNTKNINNENVSPNNLISGKTKTSDTVGSIPYPTTTKNAEIRNNDYGEITNSKNNGFIIQNPQSSSDKKIFRINSISDLKTKKDIKGSNTVSTKENLIKKEFKQKVVKANLDRVKISHKNFGVIESYSAITTEGLYRDYNEDRVAIIFNVSKPPNFIEDCSNPWPNCSFYGLYDGHGGSGCADFLRDNLHKFIISDSNFPKNPQKAILNGFIKIEKTFLQNCIITDKTETGERVNILERSGSCAIVVLIIDKRCYIANVGDSRAIMSGNFGDKVYSLSRDHRPNDEKEYSRVLEAGGKIYQTESNYSNSENYKSNILGPLRVVPGKLSVSRTIGDVEAKDFRLGGNPNVVIGTPEIKYFDINSNNDFIVIGCDGVFEKLKNKEIIDSMWNVINSPLAGEIKDLHNLTGILAENIVDNCLNKRSTDNLTAIVICLKKNLDRNSHLGNTYTSQTQQLNKIPKIIKTENQSTQFENNSQNNSNILSKIIKSTQSKTTTFQKVDKYMQLNK